MRKNRKVLALIFGLIVLAAIVATYMYTQSRYNHEFGSAVVNQSINDKTNMLTLETYLTAKTVSTEERVIKPTNIVLVLDNSGFMNDKYDKQNTCLQAMQNAVNGFVDCVGEAYADSADHKISVVTFNGSASILADWTDADSKGISAIKDKVNKLEKADGACSIDLALEQAKALIDANAAADNGVENDRKLMVVLFSCGYPGKTHADGDYFSNYYGTNTEADKAVAAAAELKKMGATVYTVGAFENADPAESYTTTENSIVWKVWHNTAKSANGLMHFISNDYDESCTSWQDNTTDNDGRNNGFYLKADNTDALTRAFNETAYAIVHNDCTVQPDSDYVLKYVITDYFKIDGEVSVYTADYDAKSGTFGEEEPYDVEVNVSDNTVSVVGYNYSRHWCADGARNGQKLIIKVPVKDTVDDFGIYPTIEDVSGLYNSEGKIVVFAPPAKASVVNLIDLSVNETSLPDTENYLLKVLGQKSSYFQNLWPTMKSMRTIDDKIYLIDYQYDYDIDDLMSKGVSSAAELLTYASSKIAGDRLSFKMGQMGTACSAYEAHNENGEHIMGRNFDYMDAPCYVIWTHPDDAYASVSMVDGNFLLTTDKLKPTSTMGRYQTMLSPYLCLDGINETGFAISVLQIHADGTKQDNGKTDMFTTAMIRCCLDKCSSVNEAIELFKSFDMQDTIVMGYSLGCCFHYMLTDATGDAAVIEYVNNEMRITRAGDKGFDNLFVTNYYLAEDGGKGMEAYDPEGMERYEIIADTLAENKGVLKFNQAFDLLSDIHLNYRHNNGLYDITTLWSCLYNNNQQTMSLAARMDYSKIYTFDVNHPMRVFSIDSVDVKTPFEGIGLH